MQQFKRHSLTKQLMDVIISGIESGEFELGQKLPSEADMAEKLRVSRNTLREALKALDTFGIIESIHGQGTFVTENAKRQIPNIEVLEMLTENANVQSLLDARLVIEPGLARLAAERRSEDDIDCISNSVDFFVNESHSLDEIFHMQVARAAKSPILYGYLTAVYQKLIHTPYPLLQERLLTDKHDDEVREHKGILDAIIERDASSARELMYMHLKRRFRLVDPDRE